MSTKSKWAGVVGHVISVGKYDFSIVVIDYVIRVSELTSGSLLFTVTLEGDTLAMTATEERALLFYETVIGTSVVDYLNKMVELGYTNSYQKINAMQHGIPQKRERLFVVSMLSGRKFDFSKVRKRELKPIDEFLVPESEVGEQHIISIPSMLNKIPEHYKMTNSGYTRMLDVIDTHCWTITERQDRCPNAGVIKMSDGRYRYLTEREVWRLMGFDDTHFDAVLKEFPTKAGKRNATLYAMAGNSIVVTVMEDLLYSVIFDEHPVGETETVEHQQKLSLA